MKLKIVQLYICFNWPKGYNEAKQPPFPILKKQLRLITKSTIVSDIVYSPKNTTFLKKFPKNKKIYGISMLIEQAKPCFKIWFGKNPSVDKKMLKAIYKKI